MINEISIKILLTYCLISAGVITLLLLSLFIISIYNSYKINKILSRKLDIIHELLEENINMINLFSNKTDHLGELTDDIHYIISLSSKTLAKYKDEINSIKEKLYNLSEEEIYDLIDDIDKIKNNVELIINNISIITEALEGDKWVI